MFLNKPILNVYPDSLNLNIDGLYNYLKINKEVFSTIYILPTIFNSDLDRGFSIINYEINKNFATEKKLEELKELGYYFKLDFVINHLSINSPQFQDIIHNGDKSNFVDFFIDWNKFWEGFGELSDFGYIIPNNEYLDKMHFRKPGLPLLSFKDDLGKVHHYWNTFYNKKELYITVSDVVNAFNVDLATATKFVSYLNNELNADKLVNDIVYLDYDLSNIESILRCELKGQMDLNLKSEKVWAYYKETLQKLKSYGASVIRLDAFAYASKVIGKSNFLNNPETWDVLNVIEDMVKDLNLMILPEIHSKYKDFVHLELANRNFLTYDFFLPGLIIDLLENKNPKYLKKWFNEIISNNIKTINMLGCHDGIPILDLEGLLPTERIEELVNIITNRGGLIKELNGKKNVYYQVNSTYYTALGESEEKLILARAIQLFMPGTPQIWYLDLFCGKNNIEKVDINDPAWHKEINRTNLSMKDMETAESLDLYKSQLELIKLRNNHKAFSLDSNVIFKEKEKGFIIKWIFNDDYAKIDVDLLTYKYKIITS